jgi:hypothetical protein
MLERLAGRRAIFTCGMKDGDTVALLGDLEPAEGGFRILRARIAGEAALNELLSAPRAVITSDGVPYRGEPAALREALRRGELRYHEGRIRGAFPRIVR